MTGCDWEGMVRAFHEKYGHPVDRDIAERATDRGDVELFAARMFVGDAMDSVTGATRVDMRAFRVRLILEETAELLEALENRDKVATADALADLAYVVVGTAVAYGIPVGAVIEEVHRSNMTKDPAGPGSKPTKGASYSPPDVGGVL